MAAPSCRENPEETGQNAFATFHGRVTSHRNGFGKVRDLTMHHEGGGVDFQLSCITSFKYFSLFCAHSRGVYY